MAKPAHSNANNSTESGTSQTGSSTKTFISTQLPGVDMTQVIASEPYMVKENSSKIQTREIKIDRG